MKHLLPLLIFLASCGPSRYLECPKYVGIAIDTIPTDSTWDMRMNKVGVVYRQIGHSDTFKIIRPLPLKPDTVPEWMHVSRYQKGFVIVQTALSVRIDGICTAHLDCAGKPFPAHYHVGWCEGKEELFNRLVKGRGR
jgi:hypothetical protein